MTGYHSTMLDEYHIPREDWIRKNQYRGFYEPEYLARTLVHEFFADGGTVDRHEIKNEAFIERVCQAMGVAAVEIENLGFRFELSLHMDYDIPKGEKRKPVAPEMLRKAKRMLLDDAAIVARLENAALLLREEHRNTIIGRLQTLGLMASGFALPMLGRGPGVGTVLAGLLAAGIFLARTEYTRHERRRDIFYGLNRAAYPALTRLWTDTAQEIASISVSRPSMDKGIVLSEETHGAVSALINHSLAAHRNNPFGAVFFAEVRPKIPALGSTKMNIYVRGKNLLTGGDDNNRKHYKKRLIRPVPQWIPAPALG